MQADLAALAPLVAPGEFAGQRALVVGGSRGLGEATVKLLAAGGADVVLTYRQGEADARRVAAEIGGRAIAFDCTAPPADLGFLPTHLYYFATPPITVGDLHAFSGAAFTRYCRYYVDGFAHSVRAAHAATGGPLEVFYPSTVYLDEPGRAWPSTAGPRRPARHSRGTSRRCCRACAATAPSCPACAPIRRSASSASAPRSLSRSS